LITGECIRVTGIVQGVGFRPAVWRLAGECGVTGRVWNDAGGVLIHAWGSRESLDVLVRRLRDEQPPLSRIESITRSPLVEAGATPAVFEIVASREGEVRTRVHPAFKPPQGEAYGRLEGPKGELGFYLVSDGSPKPYRFKVRAPTLINLTVLRDLVVGWKLADAIVTFGSIDICMGEVDR